MARKRYKQLRKGANQTTFKQTMKQLEWQQHRLARSRPSRKVTITDGDPTTGRKVVDLPPL